MLHSFFLVVSITYIFIHSSIPLIVSNIFDSTLWFLCQNILQTALDKPRDYICSSLTAYIQDHLTSIVHNSKLKVTTTIFFKFYPSSGLTSQTGNYLSSSRLSFLLPLSSLLFLIHSYILPITTSSQTHR